MPYAVVLVSIAQREKIAVSACEDTSRARGSEMLSLLELPPWAARTLH